MTAVSDYYYIVDLVCGGNEIEIKNNMRRVVDCKTHV